MSAYYRTQHRTERECAKISRVKDRIRFGVCLFKLHIAVLREIFLGYW